MEENEKTLYELLTDCDKDFLFADTTLEAIIRAWDEIERVKRETKYLDRAKELKCYTQCKKLLKAYKEFDENNVERAPENRYTLDFPKHELVLACGDWECDEKGVRKTIEGKVITASTIPVMPVMIIWNRETKREKLKIDFYKNGKWRSLVCDRSVAANKSKIIELSNMGLEVNSDNSAHLVTYISDVIQRNRDNLLKTVEGISRCGWVKNGFVPYGSEFFFDGEENNRSLFESISRKGTLEEWTAYVKSLRGNMYFRMQMAASFASVLIERTGTLPFVLHLWGGTGSGKTVGLMGAMSVWGNPSLGKLVRTMNMTNNALMDTAAFLHSLPFAGDELQTIKNCFGNYDNLIMQITEGINRGRMKYDKQEALKTWRNAFLFTGEEPCTKTGSGGGVINRVIEIEVTGKVVENGNEAAEFFRNHYGMAGKHFVENINANEAKELYNSIFKELLSANTTEKQAMSAALCMTADKLAGNMFFKGEKPLCLDDVKGFLKTAKEVSLSERAFEYICGEIARNMKRFDRDNNFGEIWGKTNEAKGEICINKNVLTELLGQKGFNFDAVKRDWAEKGYLRKYGTEFTSAQRIGNVIIRCAVLQVANAINTENEQLPF